MNESFVPSINDLRECPTPPPTDNKSITLPLRVEENSIVLASTYLIKYSLPFVNPPIGVADLLFG